MIYKISNSAIATCITIISLGVSSSAAQTFGIKPTVFSTNPSGFGINSHGGLSTPTQPLAVPPGMVPMIVYVPAQQMHSQPMAAPAAPPVAPHTHAPQAALTINATHCSINDVGMLTKDVPSCQKAGGKVVAEKASFGRWSNGGLPWCKSYSVECGD